MNEAPTGVDIIETCVIGTATFTLTLQRWGTAPDTYEVGVADRRPGARHRFTVIGTFRGLDHAREVFETWTQIEHERFA
jgi:hypothetical protein